MAPVAPKTTTVTAPVAVLDNVLRVAAATDITVKSTLKIDDEECSVDPTFVGGQNVPVLRGRGNTVAAVHAAGAVVTIDPYAALYEGLILTADQYADLCTRLEGLINEYVDVSHKAIATERLHDILKRLPVQEAPVAAPAKPAK